MVFPLSPGLADRCICSGRRPAHICWPGRLSLGTALGLRRAFEHLIGASLIGATLMVAADWLGRIVTFPFQLPAGLVATLIGVPYLIWHLTRRER
ncbi:iron chelate uptake ABC transporter family permease subunit [Microvirga soli]|uniref:iron chelate uptake ABC transporter family permease subunit n=1 Tax=Microvirga soli TaxID=1854496 RepID=UPI001FECCEA4|nr:iron chelate uptake ABC transporter family permease subunit [Microvirga soli]